MQQLNEIMSMFIHLKEIYQFPHMNVDEIELEFNSLLQLTLTHFNRGRKIYISREKGRKTVLLNRADAV